MITRDCPLPDDIHEELLRIHQFPVNCTNLIDLIVPELNTFRLILTVPVQYGYGNLHISLADLGRACQAHAPLRVQILSFGHTKFSKHNCLGSQCPPHDLFLFFTSNEVHVTLCDPNVSAQHEVWRFLLCFVLGSHHS